MNSDSNRKKMGAILAYGTFAAMLFITQKIKNNKLELEKSELDKIIESISAEKDEINNKLVDELSVNNILRKELEKLQNEGYETSYNEVLIYAEKVKELQSKINNLTDLISIKDKEIKNMQHKNNEHELKFKTHIANKNEQIDELYKEVTYLRGELVKKTEEDDSVFELQMKIKELNDEIYALKTRNSGQSEKIRELKNQLKECTKELETTKDELSTFKSKINEIIESKNRESNILKDLSRTTDRVSKKINKSGGKR